MREVPGSIPGTALLRIRVARGKHAVNLFRAHYCCFASALPPQRSHQFGIGHVVGRRGVNDIKAVRWRRGQMRVRILVRSDSQLPSSSRWSDLV